MAKEIIFKQNSVVNGIIYGSDLFDAKRPSFGYEQFLLAKSLPVTGSDSNCLMKAIPSGHLMKSSSIEI